MMARFSLMRCAIHHWTLRWNHVAVGDARKNEQGGHAKNLAGDREYQRSGGHPQMLAKVAKEEIHADFGHRLLATDSAAAPGGSTLIASGARTRPVHSAY